MAAISITLNIHDINNIWWPKLIRNLEKSSKKAQ